MMEPWFNILYLNIFSIKTREYFLTNQLRFDMDLFLEMHKTDFHIASSFNNAAKYSKQGTQRYIIIYIYQHIITKKRWIFAEKNNSQQHTVLFFLQGPC